MGYRESVTRIDSDASGDGEGYSDYINGRITSISLVFHASAGAGTDTVVTEDGGAERAILTVNNSGTSATFPVRAEAVDAAGAALTYDGTNPVPVDFELCGRRVHIVIADVAEALTDAVIAYIRYEQKG